MTLARLGLGLFLLITLPVHAELIQILHTNDLHSHLEHAPHRPEIGGYARMKVLIDRHRALAGSQGIGTISMDGGDTMEGNLYYVANKGRKTLEAFNRIGYDVSVLGNHDYLMAADDLEAILRDVPPAFSLLAANFKMSKDFPEINQHIRPVYETVVSGVKVGVVGITLNDMLYKWRLKGHGKIEGEVEAARHWARYLRERGNEVVIALTHIGVAKDKKLALNVPELDLIVGGHSHTALHEVVYQRSKNGKRIPIVQAGKHGEWLGKLLLDYDREKATLKVQSYELMAAESDEKDPGIQELIARANDDLYDFYGKEWLEGVVGKSFLRGNNPDDAKVWHFFINDAMMEAAHTDFSIHADALSGENYPLGDVTRRSLYDGNPRTFDFRDKYGYHVYTAKVNGALIKVLATATMNLNVPLYFSGITFKWERKPNGKYRVWDIRHKGGKIKLFKSYDVSFSEAIVRGGYNISALTGLILRKGKRTKTSMWQALEEKFLRERELHPDYLDRYYRREAGLTGPAREMERVLVVPSEE